MIAPKIEFIQGMHRWQWDLFRAFDMQKYRYFLLCWHRRARKTTAEVNILIKECCKKQAQPRVYVYVAPTYKQAKAIIWQDPNMLFKWIPESAIEKKSEVELIVWFKTGNMLIVKGADDPDSLRGIDAYGVVFDEFALIKPEVWEEIFRPIISEKKGWAMFSFTPKGQNHAYEMWKKAENYDDWFRSYLPCSESKLIAADELERDYNEMPKSLYMQEYECSFVAEADVDSMFSMKRIEECFETPIVRYESHKVISIDPASMGDDHCVFQCWENEQIMMRDSFGKTENREIIGHALYLEQMMNDDVLFVVDNTNLQGISQKLMEMEKNVLPIHFGEKATDDTKYFNKRSEMYGHARDMVYQHKVKIPRDYIELHQDLCLIRYMIHNERLLKLWPKDKIKKELGRSPDHADAFVLGLWGIDWLSSADGQEKFRKRQEKFIPEWQKARERNAWEREIGQTHSEKGAYT